MTLLFLIARFIARWLIWATLIIWFVINIRSPNQPPTVNSSYPSVQPAVDVPASDADTATEPSLQETFLVETQEFLVNVINRSAAIQTSDMENFVRGFPLSQQGLDYLHELRIAAITDLAIIHSFEDASLGDFIEAKYKMIRIIELQISIFDELLAESNQYIQPGNAYHTQKLNNLERKLREFKAAKIDLINFYKNKLQELERSDLYTLTELDRNSG